MIGVLAQFWWDKKRFDLDLFDFIGRKKTKSNITEQEIVEIIKFFVHEALKYYLKGFLPNNRVGNA